MRKILIALGLVGLLSQPVLAQAVITPSCGCPTGMAAPVTVAPNTFPVQQPCMVCPTTGGAAPVNPVMVPVEKKKPRWKFWGGKQYEYRAVCPVCPTGGAAPAQQMQPAQPIQPIIQRPVITPKPVPSTGGASRVRGYW